VRKSSDPTGTLGGRASSSGVARWRNAGPGLDSSGTTRCCPGARHGGTLWRCNGELSREQCVAEPRTSNAWLSRTPRRPPCWPRPIDLAEGMRACPIPAVTVAAGFPEDLRERPEAGHDRDASAVCGAVELQQVPSPYIHSPPYMITASGQMRSIPTQRAEGRTDGRTQAHRPRAAASLLAASDVAIVTIAAIDWTAWQAGDRSMTSCVLVRCVFSPLSCCRWPTAEIQLRRWTPRPQWSDGGIASCLHKSVYLVRLRLGFLSFWTDLARRTHTHTHATIEQSRRPHCLAARPSETPGRVQLFRIVLRCVPARLGDPSVWNRNRTTAARLATSNEPLLVVLLEK